VDSFSLTNDGASFVDGYGRQVVMRGFNVSGTAKLAECGNLPFATVADAERSAVAMKSMTGANVIRFLVTWAGIEPTSGVLDTDYLDRAIAQMLAFVDQGMRVYLGWHQDLFSAHLFNARSKYAGDGAPEWVVAAGDYPPERSRLSVSWAQSYISNAVVRAAFTDFWHGRVLSTSVGEVVAKDQYLQSAGQALAYVKEKLSDEQFAHFIGVHPFNEPSPGNLTAGESVATWERDRLWPFYQEFRAVMDEAGWADKSTMIEPEVQWNSSIPFVGTNGGLRLTGPLGKRYVFNAHYYNGKAQTLLLLPLGDKDGGDVKYLNEIRQRALESDCPAMVGEFGFTNSGFSASNASSVLKGTYQALDSSVSGRDWWAKAGGSGQVLSGTHWHWDIYSGRHHERFNGTDRILAARDAWNAEDFSVVAQDDTGTIRFTQDERLLDRLYPMAVAGAIEAFTYEDRSKVGTWNPIPRAMPHVAELVGAGQYAVLVWRAGHGQAPTELRLPTTFREDNTTVLTSAVSSAFDDGVLALSTLDDSGTTHYALIANGLATPTTTVLDAARQELGDWLIATFGD
jgi:hypothetical protein